MTSCAKRCLRRLAVLVMRRRGPCPPRPRRILVVAVGFLGDMVIIQPFLHALRLALPGARISLMLESHCLPLVAGSAAVDDVISYERRWARAPRHLIPFILKMRRERFDVAVVHYGHFHIEDALFFMGIRHTIGYHTDLGFERTVTYELFSHRVMKSWRINEIDNSFALLRAMGVEAHPQRRHLTIPAAKAIASDKSLNRFGATEQGAPLVLMHIGAGYRTKKWPPGRWARTGDLLGEALPVGIYITGSAQDIGEQDEILVRMRAGATGLCGRTSIEELVALLARADLLITTDSGPKHFAYALAVPTVEIYGPSEWWRWGAYWDKHIHLALDKKPHPRINPDLVEDARYDPVIQQITAEEAAGAAVSLLRRAKGGGS